MPPCKQLFLSFLLTICCSPLIFSQIYLTEIMFDPLGDENTDEFVEIWNCGEYEISLAGYSLGDGTGLDQIISAGGGISLLPGWFALILDPDYFTESTVYDSLFGEYCLLLTVEGAALGDRGLKNSAGESVELLDWQGNVIASYTYTIGNQPGFSEEKIILDGPDELANWGESVILHGTPGFYNSISPDSLNLALVSLSYQPALPVSGQGILLSLIIENRGISDFSEFRTGFYVDNGDSILSTAEIFTQIISDSLSSDSTEIIEVETGTLNSGLYLFAAALLTPDDDSTDNAQYVQVYVPTGENAILFNEIMHRPVSGEAEWIELYNTTPDDISLTGWSINEGDIASIVGLDNSVIKGDSYAVIAQGGAVFNFSLPAYVPLVIPFNWSALNNSGDTLYLCDPAGNLMDVLQYPDNWGGSENGISMERVSPSSALWFPSAHTSGATPGRENSVHLEGSSGAKADITVIPETFSPDGDGIADEVEIRVSLPVPYSRISLRIFDVRGRLVRFLAEGINAGPNSAYYWDGKWEDGKVGRIGPYIIHLEAISESFKKKYEAKTVVVLGGRL